MPNNVATSEFKELPPAARAAVDAFIRRFPTVRRPKYYPRLRDLADHIEEYLAGLRKQGRLSYSFSFSLIACLCSLSAVVIASTKNIDKSIQHHGHCLSTLSCLSLSFVFY
jgi:hypothetical protein